MDVHWLLFWLVTYKTQARPIGNKNIINDLIISIKLFNNYKYVYYLHAQVEPNDREYCLCYVSSCMIIDSLHKCMIMDVHCTFGHQHILPLSVNPLQLSIHKLSKN